MRLPRVVRRIFNPLQERLRDVREQNSLYRKAENFVPQQGGEITYRTELHIPDIRIPEDVLSMLANKVYGMGWPTWNYDERRGLNAAYGGRTLNATILNSSLEVIATGPQNYVDQVKQIIENL